MIRALTITTALLVAAPSAIAATWVELHNHMTFEPSKMWIYQIDMQSLVERNGWTYGNTRVLTGLPTTGMRPSAISVSQFHCKKQQIKWLGGPLKTRNAKGEWWHSLDTQKGTRNWGMDLSQAEWTSWDREMNDAFDFVCKGE